MKHEHTPEAISARFAEGPEDSYLRDWVYGGIDGTVTTFAVVAGVAGAALDPKIILILGAANILADGFSMAAANFVGTRTEHEEYQRLKVHEELQITEDPTGERLEVEEIYRRKGFNGPLLAEITRVVTADPQLWVRTMLTEEYGYANEPRGAAQAALATFGAFVVCGAVPLIPFVAAWPEPLRWASVLTCLCFFGIGSLKSRWSERSFWYSGTETLILGGLAAALAYIVGTAFRGA